MGIVVPAACRLISMLVVSIRMMMDGCLQKLVLQPASCCSLDFNYSSSLSRRCESAYDERRAALHTVDSTGHNMAWLHFCTNRSFRATR